MGVVRQTEEGWLAHVRSDDGHAGRGRFLTNERLDRRPACPGRDRPERLGDQVGVEGVPDQPMRLSELVPYP